MRKVLNFKNSSLIFQAPRHAARRWEVRAQSLALKRRVDKENAHSLINSIHNPDQEQVFVCSMLYYTQTPFKFNLANCGKAEKNAISRHINYNHLAEGKGELKKHVRM